MYSNIYICKKRCCIIIIYMYVMFCHLYIYKTKNKIKGGGMCNKKSIDMNDIDGDDGGMHSCWWCYYNMYLYWRLMIMQKQMRTSSK